MKFRILETEGNFIPQYKLWYWPFWIYIKQIGVNLDGKQFKTDNVYKEKTYFSAGRVIEKFALKNKKKKEPEVKIHPYCPDV